VYELFSQFTCLSLALAFKLSLTFGQLILLLLNNSLKGLNIRRQRWVRIAPWRFADRTQRLSGAFGKPIWVFGWGEVGIRLEDFSRCFRRSIELRGPAGGFGVNAVLDRFIEKGGCGENLRAKCIEDLVVRNLGRLSGSPSDPAQPAVELPLVYPE
jgi:hypothetical protein